MKTTSFALLLMASLAFVLLGCNDNSDPLAPPNSKTNAGQPGVGVLEKAMSTIDREVFPLDGFINPGDCLQEMLHLTGSIYVRWHWVVDGNGDLKLFTDHSTFPDITATTESGVSYKLIYHNHTVQVEGHVYRVVDELVLIGPPGGAQLLGKVMYHITWTPSGEVTAYFDRFDVHCK